jgi:hypothetical protein
MMQGIQPHIARFCILLFLIFQGNNHHKHFHFDWFHLPSDEHGDVHFHTHDCDAQSHISENCAVCDFTKVVADVSLSHPISQPQSLYCIIPSAKAPSVIFISAEQPKNKAPPCV